MENRTNKANKITFLGLLVNIFLTLFKLFAGIAGKSTAMLADAFHSLSDFATDIIILLGFRFVDKPVDKSHDYGHGKIETLLSVIIGVLLGFVGAGIFRAGIDRIWDAYNGYTIPAPKWIAFYAAIVSILTKESLYHYTNIVGKKINSQAIIANAWHHRSDALSSVGALLGIGGAIFLGEQWYILDPIAAVVVSFFIVKTAVVISFNAFNELTEASLSDETEHKILDIIRGVSGISSPHNLRTRRIGNYIAIDVHVRVDKRMNITEAHDISVKVEDRIKEEFGEGTFILVHVEPEH